MITKHKLYNLVSVLNNILKSKGIDNHFSLEHMNNYYRLAFYHNGCIWMYDCTAYMTGKELSRWIDGYISAIEERI